MIVRFAAAERLLAEAKTVAEVAAVVDGIQALRDLFRKVAHDQRRAKEAAALALRGMRKGGQMIADAHPHAGRPSAGNPVTLTGLGVDENRSKRWQRIARVAHDVFEGYLAHALESDDAEVTQVGLSLWAEGLREELREEAMVWSRDGVDILEISTKRVGESFIEPPPFMGDYADAGEEMEARRKAAERIGQEMKNVILVMGPEEYAAFLADIAMLKRHWHLTRVRNVVREAVRRARLAAQVESARVQR